MGEEMGIGEEMGLHIGIMGAGAIGGYVGGRLAARGETQVTLIGRKPLADAIAEHGVTLREFDRGEHVDAAMFRIEEGPNALSSCDVVFCCVKSGATAEAATMLANVLQPEAVVVSLQNGLRNPETLRSALPRNPVLPAVVDFNVIIRDGAVFQRTTSGPLVIETRADGQDGPWVEALRASGIEVEEVRPIAAVQWTKLLVNLNNAVGALSGAATREIILSRQYRRVVAKLLDEGLDVLREAGVRPAKFRGVPLRVMSFILKLPTPIVRVVIRAQLRVDPEARVSMWTDLERGRLTEVEFLNGEIVRLAEQHGAAAPNNRRIVELVHEAERAGAGSPGMSAEALLAALENR
jgi:2-dehydropantoate 2-reductase